MSFADDMREEAAALARRHIYHTRKPGPHTWEEAAEMCRRMDETMKGHKDDDKGFDRR